MKSYAGEERRSLYQQWLGSGQGKAAFPKAQQIEPAAFYYWIKEFQQQLPAASAKSAGFSLVQGEQNPGSASRQAVARTGYPSGVWIERYEMPDVALLKALAG